jgi:arylsulfatase A-like enzyme
VQAYLAAISYCDGKIGEIVAALDRSAYADDTAIVVWGDNGFHLGEKLHWRKFVLWEEATRVPLIVVPPRRHRTMQTLVDTPVSLTDIFPTLFDRAGLTQPFAADGRSLVPLMRGEKTERDGPVVTTWMAGNHSLRSGPWRYTRYHTGGEELYDHRTDPYEWNNLAGQARFASTLANFHRLLV